MAPLDFGIHIIEVNDVVLTKCLQRNISIGTFGRSDKKTFFLSERPFHHTAGQCTGSASHFSKKRRLFYTFNLMFKKLKELYRDYKPYVRVDLIMYAVLILLIITYFIISTVW